MTKQLRTLIFNPLSALPYLPAGSVRNHLSGAFLAGALTLGILVTTAAPASAASYVSGCFASSQAGYNLQGVPAQLQAWYQGAWYTVATSPLPLNGCVAWTLGTNYRSYYMRMVIDYRLNTAFWTGVTPLLAPPGDLAYNLGKGVVTCYGCQ